MDEKISIDFLETHVKKQIDVFGKCASVVSRLLNLKY